MPHNHRNAVTQLFTPGQRLESVWREAADEVWSTWEELRHAPRSTREGAFAQHLHALDMEHRAATALATHHLGHAALASADLSQLAA
jgi:hypothetical protein